MGITPLTGRISPLRDSSPMNTVSLSSAEKSWPLAASRDTAMGRSYTEPSFLRSAGARFTVMRVEGISKPLFFIAERTRSRDSFTAASGSPTVS